MGPGPPLAPPLTWLACRLPYQVTSVFEALDFFFCSQSCAGSPVDKLLFLTSRAQWKTQESAVLVSSEAGTLEFWCLYGVNRPMGM